VAIEQQAMAGRQAAPPRTSGPQATGLRARLALRLAAMRKSRRRAWVLAALGLWKGQRILQIGFGTGADIVRVRRLTEPAVVCGIDAAPEMLAVAWRRLRKASAEGEVKLQCAEASALPYDDASFDRVLAISGPGLWRAVDPAIAELARVLRPGGRTVLGIECGPGQSDIELRQLGARLVDALVRNGVTVVDVAWHDEVRPVMLCIVGIKVWAA
jgi:ubiquinone/menaquinone biosynthesis C-methylase UbiE